MPLSRLRKRRAPGGLIVRAVSGLPFADDLDSLLGFEGGPDANAWSVFCQSM